MSKIRTFLAVVAATTLGASLFMEPARAELGAGGSAIGSGGAAIGKGAVQEASAVSEAAPRVFGNCITNRTAYRTQTNQVLNSTGGFTVMPNTHFPVTHQAGCLIVDFVSEVLGFVDTGMEIRAWIGGIGAAEPPTAILGPPVVSNSPETRSMRFVFPNVPAGQHTVRIEWRSLGNMVGVINRTLTVQYR